MSLGCDGCTHDEGEDGCALLNLSASPALDMVWVWCNEMTDDTGRTPVPGAPTCPGREGVS